jgi:hypothetical protein
MWHGYVPDVILSAAKDLPGAAKRRREAASGQILRSLKLPQDDGWREVFNPLRRGR